MAERLSIGTAWAEAAAFLRKERRLLAPVVLGLILLPTVVSTMVQPPAPTGASPEPGPWMLVALAMVLVMMVGQMAIVILDGWRGSVGEAIGRAARRLPTLVLAALIVMIPLMLLFAIVLAGIALATGGGGQFAPMTLTGGGALTIVLFTVLMLFVAVRLMPLVAIVARGTDGPIAALKRTFRITRGEFLRLLGFFLLLAIAFFVAAAAVGAVVGSIVILALGQPEAWSVSLLLIVLAGALIQTAFVTLYTAMTTRIAAQLDDSTSGT